jgi:hypothetical protein
VSGLVCGAVCGAVVCEATRRSFAEIAWGISLQHVSASFTEDCHTHTPPHRHTATTATPPHHHTSMTMNSDAATEIKALWASQEMLIHSNDALQKELAEFRGLFEAKLPVIKNQSLAKAKLMEAVRYLKDNYDKELSDMNPRLVLHYSKEKNLKLDVWFVITDPFNYTHGLGEPHASEDRRLMGMWHVRPTETLPFLVNGTGSYFDSGDMPRGMGWKDVEEFEFRALDKLVTGADGWTLDHISHQINKAYIDSDSNESTEDDVIEHYLWRLLK